MNDENQSSSSPGINFTNGGCRDCGRFFLDVVGHYTQREVHTQWVQSPYDPGPTIRGKIEQAWAEQCKLACNRGSKLYDGPLCGLIDFKVDDTGLSLTLGPTCFKDFVGTNITNPCLRYQHGPEALANPLGVSAAVVTADNFILMGRRSKKVMYHGGRIHSIGGMVEPSPSGLPPSPFDAIIHEIVGELNIPADKLGSILCLGMVREKPIVQPEMVFDVSIGVDACTVRQLAKSAVDADEHDELVLIQNYPSSVVTFIQNNLDVITPVGMSALLLHGLWKWGSGWFASTRGHLQSVIS
jgi:hypothetical protein